MGGLACQTKEAWVKIRRSEGRGDRGGGGWEWAWLQGRVMPCRQRH